MVRKSPPPQGFTGRDFHDGADHADERKNDHATQALAYCSCRGIAGCGGVSPDLRLRLGLPSGLARRLVSRGSALLCRRTRLLWLRRLLRPRTGPNPLGTPLASGEPLLLTVFDDQ